MHISRRTLIRVRQNSFLLAALLWAMLLSLALLNAAHAATSRTVIGWGSGAGANIPVGLSDVTAISAGAIHSLALKSDGMVVGWGDDVWGQASVPAGLSGVTAISAARFHSLALKNDGTIFGWGQGSDGQLDIPVGLSDVIAIAAGSYHNLALKRDGTVVAWGYNGD